MKEVGREGSRVDMVMEVDGGERGEVDTKQGEGGEGWS